MRVQATVISKVTSRTISRPVYASMYSRIRTVFGEERVMFLDTPFLIASVRTESLSQGGKFAVGWSGLTGIRLNYRKAYTEWHNSEHFKSNYFIPMNSSEERSFVAPEEILP